LHEGERGGGVQREESGGQAVDLDLQGGEPGGWREDEDDPEAREAEEEDEQGGGQGGGQREGEGDAPQRAPWGGAKGGSRLLEARRHALEEAADDARNDREVVEHVRQQHDGEGVAQVYAEHSPRSD